MRSKLLLRVVNNYFVGERVGVIRLALSESILHLWGQKTSIYTNVLTFLITFLRRGSFPEPNYSLLPSTPTMRVKLRAEEL